MTNLLKVNMRDMNHECNLTIKFVQDEDNAEQGLESPLSDIEMLNWELLTGDIDQPPVCPDTRGHDMNPGPLNQRTEVCRSDRSQKKNGYKSVPSKDPNHSNELQLRESQPRQSCKKRRFNFFLAALVLFLVILVVVVLIVKLKPHQVESSQPSVQALARDAEIYADEGKWITGLCWKEDASCKEPYCYYATMDIAALVRVHEIDEFNQSCNGQNNTKFEKELMKCNDNLPVNNYDVAEKLLNKSCEPPIKCCHVKYYGQNYFSISGKDNHQIASLICEHFDTHSSPTFQCQPGWGGKRCNETHQIQITCRCYKSKSNSFCVNYTNCSEMVFVNNTSSLCRNNSLTHCLDESKVCKSQFTGGDQCLCDIKDKDLNCCKTDIEEMNGSEPGDKDLCWRTDALCMKGYCNKANRAFPLSALVRVHEIDEFNQSCNGQNNIKFEKELMECNDNLPVNNYDVAEKLLNKSCEPPIKCCHVKYYGQNYFNISGKGKHQIASLICEHFDRHSSPTFQCQPGWGGTRCNEKHEMQIDCGCFQSYSLCENKRNCSEMMYLGERNSLCSKDNLTHCEFESDICRTEIQGKECLCNVSAHLTEDMKGQPNLINSAAVLGRFTGIFTRNSLVFVICFVLVHLHQST